LATRRVDESWIGESSTPAAQHSLLDLVMMPGDLESALRIFARATTAARKALAGNERPSQAGKSRPLLNCSIAGMKASIAIAVSDPTPGIVCNRVRRFPVRPEPVEGRLQPCSTASLTTVISSTGTGGWRLKKPQMAPVRPLQQSIVCSVLLWSARPAAAARGVRSFSTWASS